MSDDHSALLAKLEAVPARLAAAAEAAELEEREVPVEGWPARFVVTHLALVEQVVWQRRLDELVRSSTPPRWQRTEPGVGDGPADASLPVLLERFDSARSLTVSTVRALAPGDWARHGLHETFGELDVAGLLREALNHDEEHLADLSRR